MFPKLILNCLLIIFALLMALPAPVAAEPSVRVVNDGQLILQDVPEIPPTLVARLKQYQNIRSAAFMDWGKDGKVLYLRTRFGEVNQIHRMYSPGGARQQLTWLESSVGEVVRRNGGQELAFTMDRAGGELDQIYLLNPRNGESRLLTGDKARNRLITWSKDGRLMAFQSTRRNGSNTDVWMMDPNRPEEAELLVESENGDWWGPVDFSADGKYLLVQQMRNVEDSRVHLLNLKTRELRLLAGSDEAPSANRAVTFDRDGTGFYYISNAREMAAELVWKSIEPDALPQHLTATIPWDVTQFALSDDGRRGAFVTNESGISRIYLLNTRSGKFSRVRNIPTGLINNLKFHPGNRALAMTLSTAQTPSDVFVIELGRSAQSAKKLQRWTFSEVGGLDTDSFIEPDLVHYPTFDLKGEQPRQIPAFVYRPKSRGPHPVIIHVHGGPEAQYRPSFSSAFQMWIAELGAAVIAPNIRGSTGYDIQYLALDNGVLREDAVKDIGALLDWIATQPDLDENRVAITGASYGGYIVLASAVHYSDRLKAGIDVVGISNFVTFLESTEDYRRDLRRYEYGDERDPEMRAFLESISPLNNVDRIDIPLLVVQGENDPRVPVSESEQIVDALRESGHEVRYIKALNEGHGYDRKENRDVFQQASIMFLQRYLSE